MVNETSPAAAERALALSYAPEDARAGVEALLALDDQLAGIVRTTSEPMVGQMRFTWWHEALTALDAKPPPANPVLQGLAAAVVPAVAGARVAEMVDGWESLLDDPLDAEAMKRFAAGRGATMFAAAAAVLGGGHPRLLQAGEGWALGDLATHLGDTAAAGLARRMADERLAGIFAPRWPVRLRALGALALLAREGVAGSPGRVGRLLWHRVSGA